MMDQSTFVDWQKAKVQENPDEVGTGAGGGGGELRVGRAALVGRAGKRGQVCIVQHVPGR